MSDVTEKFHLHDSLGFHTSQAARVIERRVEEKLRPHGLTRVTWCILLAIEEDGLINPSDISDFVGIDRTATSRALRGMEADGLIARQIGREDRRMTEVKLTDAGRQRIFEATPACRAAMDQIHEKFTAGEVEELKRLLAKIRADGAGGLGG